MGSDTETRVNRDELHESSNCHCTYKSLYSLKTPILFLSSLSPSSVIIFLLRLILFDFTLLENLPPFSFFRVLFLITGLCANRDTIFIIFLYQW